MSARIDKQVNRANAGFLAGYSGATLEAYCLDLRQWCLGLDSAGLGVFQVERAHIELYARWCESEGKAPATIVRCLSTICGFYNYCSQERPVERNPAAYVRRPKQNYESSTLGLDRKELGAFLVQAGLSGGRDHALACLLALNGLRISGALGADIGNLDVNRGHRTLFIHSKGGKDRHHPALTENRSGARSLHRRTRDGADLHEPRRHSAPRPARFSPDRQTARQASWDRQAHFTALASAFVHYRCPRCRCPAARRPRGGIPRRPQNHDALRPEPRVARPPRHLHPLNVRRWCQPLTAAERGAGRTRGD